MCLCGLGSPGALLFDHNRLLALQNSAGTTQSGLGTQSQTHINDNSEIQLHRYIKKKHQLYWRSNWFFEISVTMKFISPYAGPSCNCSCEWCASGCWEWHGSSCWWWSSHRRWQVCSDLYNIKNSTVSILQSNIPKHQLVHVLYLRY